MTLLIISQNWTTPISHYLFDLARNNYSDQTLRRMFKRNLDQETWAACEGLPEYRAIHAENAALLSKLLASMEESKVAA